MNRRDLLTGAVASAAAVVAPSIASACGYPDIMLYSDMFADVYRVWARPICSNLSALDYQTAALDFVWLSEKHGIPVREVGLSDRVFLSLYQSGELSDFGPGHGWRLNRLACPVKAPRQYRGVAS